MGWLFGKKEDKSKSNKPPILIEALSLCDFFTPLIGFAQTFSHDPTLLQVNSWSFDMDYRQILATGWDEKSIRKELKREGIDSWGSQVSGGRLIFTVHSSNGEASIALFQRLGIPY